MDRCAHCRQRDKSVRQCADCHCAAYCSRECQRVDWMHHQYACQLAKLQSMLIGANHGKKGVIIISDDEEDGEPSSSSSSRKRRQPQEEETQRSPKRTRPLLAGPSLEEADRLFAVCRRQQQPPTEELTNLAYRLPLSMVRTWVHEKKEDWLTQWFVDLEVRWFRHNTILHESYRNFGMAMNDIRDIVSNTIQRDRSLKTKRLSHAEYGQQFTRMFTAPIYHTFLVWYDLADVRQVLDDDTHHHHHYPLPYMPCGRPFREVLLQMEVESIQHRRAAGDDDSENSVIGRFLAHYGKEGGDMSHIQATVTVNALLFIARSYIRIYPRALRNIREQRPDRYDAEEQRPEGAQPFMDDEFEYNVVVAEIFSDIIRPWYKSFYAIATGSQFAVVERYRVFREHLLEDDDLPVEADLLPPLARWLLWREANQPRNKALIARTILYTAQPHPFDGAHASFKANALAQLRAEAATSVVDLSPDDHTVFRLLDANRNAHLKRQFYSVFPKDDDDDEPWLEWHPKGGLLSSAPQLLVSRYDVRSRIIHIRERIHTEPLLLDILLYGNQFNSILALDDVDRRLLVTLLQRHDSGDTTGAIPTLNNAVAAADCLVIAGMRSNSAALWALGRAFYTAPDYYRHYYFGHELSTALLDVACQLDAASFFERTCDDKIAIVTADQLFMATAFRAKNCLAVMTMHYPRSQHPAHWAAAVAVLLAYAHITGEGPMAPAPLGGYLEQAHRASLAKLRATLLVDVDDTHLLPTEQWVYTARTDQQLLNFLLQDIPDQNIIKNVMTMDAWIIYHVVSVMSYEYDSEQQRKKPLAFRVPKRSLWAKLIHLYAPIRAPEMSVLQPYYAYGKTIDPKIWSYTKYFNPAVYMFTGYFDASNSSSDDLAYNFEHFADVATRNAMNKMPEAPGEFAWPADDPRRALPRVTHLTLPNPLGGTALLHQLPTSVSYPLLIDIMILLLNTQRAYDIHIYEPTTLDRICEKVTPTEQGLIINASVTIDGYYPRATASRVKFEGLILDMIRSAGTPLLIRALTNIFGIIKTVNMLDAPVTYDGMVELTPPAFFAPSLPPHKDDWSEGPYGQLKATFLKWIRIHGEYMLFNGTDALFGAAILQELDDDRENLALVWNMIADAGHLIIPATYGPYDITDITSPL